MRVAVFGLGYVGSVSAANFAADGHDVIGVDVNPEKVAAVNAGRSPIVEPGLDELLSRCASEGRLRATTDTAEAIRDSEVSLLCVGTSAVAATVPAQAEPPLPRHITYTVTTNESEGTSSPVSDSRTLSVVVAPDPDAPTVSGSSSVVGRPTGT